MAAERAEVWKAMLRDQGILKGADLAPDAATVEFRFAHDPHELHYTIDPSTSRLTGKDLGDLVVFYSHGRNPVYHHWDDIASICIRT